jgi:hypothetical protein
MSRETRRQELLTSWERAGNRAKLEWTYRWFHQGYGKIQPVFWLIAYFGLASQDVASSLLYGLLAIAASSVVGMQYDWYDFPAVATGIAQIFDPFVRDVRSHFNVRRTG